MESKNMETTCAIAGIDLRGRSSRIGPEDILPAIGFLGASGPDGIGPAHHAGARRLVERKGLPACHRIARENRPGSSRREPDPGTGDGGEPGVID